jgi:hypothetical protein
MFWELPGHAGMQRALGLLMLRTGLTVTLLLHAQNAMPACPPWAWWCLAALAAGLMAGLLSCPCAGLSLLWCWLVLPAGVGAAPWPVALLPATAQALAVMLLGAGRWSLDRRLFGRRLVFESDDTFG